MKEYERTNILSTWIKPSSDSEQDRQERAERMVRNAIDAHPAFRGVKLRVYPKGSYPNNTNVRLDSDVDVVVQCREVLYYGHHQTIAPFFDPGGPYQGPWTPTRWRAEVQSALVNYFGGAEVDATGEVAILVRERPGSRPSTDVVPSFDYRLYWDQTGASFSDGSTVFKRTSGAQIVNWPDQQLILGRDKNDRTNRRYKSFVRALKNAENALCETKVLQPVPSYLMECLVYNVRDQTLTSGDLVEGFKATLVELYAGLTDSSVHSLWVEPNCIKLLFGSHQKWSVADATALVLQTWNLLYG